jgi:hypothetical protein
MTALRTAMALLTAWALVACADAPQASQHQDYATSSSRCQETARQKVTLKIPAGGYRVENFDVGVGSNAPVYEQCMADAGYPVTGTKQSGNPN